MGSWLIFQHHGCFAMQVSFRILERGCQHVLMEKAVESCNDENLPNPEKVPLRGFRKFPEPVKSLYGSRS